MAGMACCFPAAAAIQCHSPHVAIIGLTVWSSILALSGTWDLFTYVVFVSVLFSPRRRALFRLRQPPRPSVRTRVRLSGRADPVILGALFMVIGTLVSNTVQSIAGLQVARAGAACVLLVTEKGQVTTGDGRATR
jgi:hypothetical protein